jgi:pyruvate/2-oxoglutarate/acetoin dehydrogenase E1 component
MNTELAGSRYRTMVRQALQAAGLLSEEGVEVKVVDPRTLSPMDWETILQSVHKTGRVVLVDEVRRTCGATSEIVATLAERGLSSIPAPVQILAAPDVPVPFSPPLGSPVIPNSQRIAEAIQPFGWR